MDLSVVIVNRNTRSFLIPCVDSVLSAQGDLSVEVIVVDEHSADGSAQAVSDRFPEVLVVDDPSDCGYGHANNLGLRLTAGRYVMTLNADTLVPSNALARLVAWMDAHPTVGVVGPKLVLAGGALDLACRRSFPTPANALYRYAGLARLFPNNPRFAGYNLTFLDDDREHEVDSVSGACMLVRREAALQTGFFDEDYFLYGEDLDWAFRIKKAGWSVWYRPEVVVTHFKGQATRQRSARMIVEFHRAMLIFYRKHYASRHPWFLNAAVAAGVVMRGMFVLARNSLRPPERKRVA